MAKNIIHFTKTILNDLPVPSKGGRPIYYDSIITGLGIRITDKGIKTFVVPKRSTTFTLGRYPGMPIDIARKEALKILSQISEGINPNNQSRDNAVKGITLSQVVSDYMRSRGTNLKENTKKGYISVFNNYLMDWGDLPIIEIKRGMVEERHRDITKKSETRANTVMRQLRAYFNYAMGQYEDSDDNPMFTHNPVSRLTHIKAWNRETRKQTVIKNYDLKKWYEAIIELPQHQYKDVYIESAEVCRDLFIFILFTGLRRREASNLKWVDIDFKDHSLTIEDTKNHEPHSLPLTPFLLEILERRKSDSLYVFQGSMPDFKSLTLDTPFNEPKNQVKRVRKISGVYFTLHDLRRTFITIAESLDINTYSLKRLLNHKDQRDVTGGYIITDMERLRKPMNKITDYILEQVK